MAKKFRNVRFVFFLLYFTLPHCPYLLLHTDESSERDIAAAALLLEAAYDLNTVWLYYAQPAKR